MKEIYTVGQALGNRPNVFSKVGDSITVSSQFLQPIGRGQYNLHEYAHLQPAVDYFNGALARDGNSFNNHSLAAAEGWAAWGVLSPDLRDGRHCLPTEFPLACEYRIVRPALAIIMYGTNDAGYRPVEQYQADMRKILDFSIAQGVIPVLSTIPLRPDMPFETTIVNTTIQELGAEYHLPVIDYFTATQGLPNFGLSADNVHPSIPPGGFSAAADFSALNLQYGYVVRNLVTLDMLEAIRAYVLADR
jgi:hypothetical protein